MTQKYHPLSRAIHWLMALLIIFLLALGIYMADFLPSDAPNKFEIYDLHKSCGVMVLILVFIRIFNRFLHQAPSLPKTLPTIEKIASHVVHVALYVLMFLVPFSGYLMSNSYGFSVHFFTIEMPNLITPNPEIGIYFSKTHKYAAYATIAAIFLHIAGALKHRFFDKPENDVLNRMI